MKYFDRTNHYSNKGREHRHKFSCLISNVAEYSFIIFMFILGLNNPHSILDYANFTTKDITVANREEVKITLRTPKKPAPKTTVSTSYAQTIATNSVQTAAATSATVSPPANNYITLAGRNIPIFRSSSTKIDAGARVGLYGSGFLYGHNTTVFGSLGSIQAFSVTLNGVTKNYTVRNRITLPKNCSDSSECAEKYMGNGGITPMQPGDKPSYRGHDYDLVLMTCAGTPVGAADATHRLIVFANEI